MATIETIELVINRVGPLQETEKGTENGNRYIVCETSRGSVVFWGSDENMSNINETQMRTVPFRAVCACTRFPTGHEHNLWVSYASQIEFLGP